MKNYLLIMTLITLMLIGAFSIVYNAQGAEWNHNSERTTPLAIGGAADLGSTAFGISQGLTEMNPFVLGIEGYGVLLPLTAMKVGLTYGILPFYSDEIQHKTSTNLTDLSWAIAGSNIIIAVSGSNPIGWVAGAGIGGYLLGCDWNMLPDCICIWDEKLEQYDPQGDRTATGPYVIPINYVYPQQNPNDTFPDAIYVQINDLKGKEIFPTDDENSK